MKNIRINIKNFIIKVFNIPFGFLMNAIDIIMWPIQKIIGVRNMPYVFLLPNLIFFGLFVIVPLGVNVAFSFTGGTELFFSNRDFSGPKHYNALFSCENYLNPNTCIEDFFWRGVYNTIFFVIFPLN